VGDRAQYREEPGIVTFGDVHAQFPVQRGDKILETHRVDIEGLAHIGVQGPIREKL
jgi:hypothetical protein